MFESSITVKFETEYPYRNRWVVRNREGQWLGDYADEQLAQVRARDCRKFARERKRAEREQERSIFTSPNRWAGRA